MDGGPVPGREHGPGRRHKSPGHAAAGYGAAPGSPWREHGHPGGDRPHPKPCPCNVAIRCRSSNDRYRPDRAASASRAGGRPPFSARQRYPVLRPIPTISHALNVPVPRQQQLPVQRLQFQPALTPSPRHQHAPHLPHVLHEY